MACNHNEPEKEFYNASDIFMHQLLQKEFVIFHGTMTISENVLMLKK